MRRQKLAAWMLFGVCGLGSYGLEVTTGGQVVWGAVASAQESATYKRQLDALGGKVTDLEKRYLKPEQLKAQFSSETRFNDAKVAYVLKQYDQASVIFLDVVTRSDAQSFSGYREAMYLLGDSLFQMRNFVGARNFLGELVKMGRGPYFQEALGKQLEVAYLLNDYNNIDDLYSQIDASSALPPALNYLRGKTLHQQGRFNEATKFFDQAAAGDPEFFYVAGYYGGVSEVSQKRLSEARARFDRLTKKAPSDPRDLQVYYLAYLALGRLDYEEGKYDEALLHYNRLPRTDPNFINAVYEATWALVQQQKFKEAQENIEILIWDDPSPDMYTRAMLLKADLSLRVKDYGQALDSFQDVLERYDPVKAQMDAFAAQHADLASFFASSVKGNLELEVPAELPAIKTRFKTEPASEWLVRGKEMRRARAMTGDLGITRAEVEESYRLLDEIDARLSSSTSLKSFSGIAEGVGMALALESELIDLRESILASEAKVLKGTMSSDELQIWQRMEQERAALKGVYASIPKDPKALEQREKEVEADYRKLRKRLDELTLELDRVKAEQRAINTYIQTQTVMLSEEAQKTVEVERAALDQELLDIEDERSRMRRLIDVFRQQFAYGSVLSAKERGAREQYRRALAASGDFLGPLRGRVASSELAQLESVRQGIPAQEARLEGYYKKMTSIVDERVVELKQQVQNERTLMQGFDQTLGLVVGDTRQVVGQLAYRNFIEKREHFTQIILRADVGKIDVLFQRKEDATQEINGLFQDRTNELKALQESFEDVRD